MLGSLVYIKLNLCNWQSFDENLKKIEESIIKGNKSLTPFSSLLFLNSPSLQKKLLKFILKQSIILKILLNLFVKDRRIIKFV